jgi:Tfp pilus assembly protein PilE
MKTAKSDNGFTVIELVVIIVILCILATVIALTYSGVRANDRDSERQTDIDIVQSQLETYYAINNKYPGTDQLNDASWRVDNLKQLKNENLQDPQWSADSSCSKDAKPVFISTATEDCYAYQVSAADGSACESGTGAPCAHYTLTAVLEDGEKYVKTSLN